MGGLPADGIVVRDNPGHPRFGKFRVFAEISAVQHSAQVRQPRGLDPVLRRLTAGGTTGGDQDGVAPGWKVPKAQTLPSASRVEKSLDS